MHASLYRYVLWAWHPQRPKEDTRFSLELEAQVVANYPVFQEISSGKNGPMLPVNIIWYSGLMDNTWNIVLNICSPGRSRNASPAFAFRKFPWEIWSSAYKYADIFQQLEGNTAGNNQSWKKKKWLACWHATTVRTSVGNNYIAQRTLHNWKDENYFSTERFHSCATRQTWKCTL